MQRIEDASLLTGRGQYGDDVGVKPGTLYAAVVRSPHAHALLGGIDASQAERAPGVRAVLTGKDIAEWSRPFVVGVKAPMEMWALAMDRVRYVGEPVAVVVAESRYLAEDAADLVVFDYRQLPAVTTIEDAIRDETVLHEGVGSNVVSDRIFRYGDPETAFANAAHRISLTVRYPRNSCTPIEGSVVVAEYLSDEEGYDVSSNFMGPFSLHTVMALALRVSGTRLRHRTFRDSGGSFGVKHAVSRAPLQPILNAGCDDFSLMLYTSGTTGKPKGVPRRHRRERAAALAHVAQNLYRRGERTLGVMPLYHTMGVRSLLSMVMVDGVFVCVPKFDSGLVLRCIAEEKIPCLYLVPTLYHDMLAYREKHGADISSVTKLGFAGAPMHDALLKRLSEAFKPELLVNHYGSSEVYTFSIDQDATRKPGSAGRGGINTRIRVVKLNATSPDELAAVNEEGQIIAELAGDEAFEQYWNRPDAYMKSIRHGWYFTGDTGYIDEDGDLFVSGRVDDMIISGGENISPVDIESVLSLHPAVDDVAVAGLKDDRWGQRVVAFVKARSPIDAEALDAHCKTSDLLNFKRPREYVFVREISKSPVGKVLRRKLVAGEYEPAVEKKNA